jgi:SHS2 domain-containing protein
MYRWVDHTAELELELAAASPEAVLAEALSAYAELAGEAAAAGGEPVSLVVDLSARDLPALLVDWLAELVFLADTEGLLPEEASLALDGTRLHATVRGRRGAPRPLVKAVTYHRAELERAGTEWRGRVVLDV